MSHESTPSVPYTEDNDRKGRTRGKAIFGDKHSQFADFTTNGQDVLADFDAAAEQRHAGNPKAIAELALQQAAAAGDWSQERIEAAQVQIDKQFENAE